MQALQFIFWPAFLIVTYCKYISFICIELVMQNKQNTWKIAQYLLNEQKLDTDRERWDERVH